MPQSLTRVVDILSIPFVSIAFGFVGLSCLLGSTLRDGMYGEFHSASTSPTSQRCGHHEHLIGTAGATLRHGGLARPGRS